MKWSFSTLAAKWSTPVDGASAAFLRISFGLVAAWEIAEYLPGRLSSYYLTTLLRFHYPGFSWLEPLPGRWMYFLAGVLIASALCVAAGFFHRVFGVVYAIGYGYIVLLDAARYQNHLYLICVLSFLLALVPVNRVASVERLLFRGDRSDTIPAWALWLLRFQIAVPYVFGAIAKWNTDWMVRAQPLKVWLSTSSMQRLPAIPVEIQAYALSWSGMLFDLLIVPALLWRRTRAFAFVAVLAFNLMNAWMFSIGVFPWLMMAASLIFFPPSWPRNVRIMPKARKIAPPSALRPARTATALIALWVAFQCLMPFRHLLFPGPVDWNERGHRFAWRMKLRDKRGSLSLHTIHPAKGRLVELDAMMPLLTTRQIDMMKHDPEMMRQFAVFASNRVRSEWRTDAKIPIFVHTSISMNGRKPQPIVDPAVDLASAPAGGDWIMPLRNEW